MEGMYMWKRVFGFSPEGRRSLEHGIDQRILRILSNA